RYRRDEEQVERRLEPYGLVLKAGVWYLRARVAGEGSSRVCRIARLPAVPAAGGRLGAAAAVDLRGAGEQRAGQFGRSILRVEEADAPDTAGWVRVTLPVESEEVAHAQLTALGAEAEVLEPSSLRERFAEEAARLAELYRR